MSEIRQNTEKCEKTDQSVSDVRFAAVNSGRGFYSFYTPIFDRENIRRRYIIKGGPGTGKSRFMNTVAARAEAKGMLVEYYRCSSDPDSLDGIIVDGRMAMMDGTAPHTVEPQVVGARDEIINLGEFWDGELLSDSYNDIVSLGILKANCYKKAYRFLAAALEVDGINRSLSLPAVRREKMQGAAERLCRTLPNGNGYELRPFALSSIGMKGRVRLDTVEKKAKQLYWIDDHFGTGCLFLNALIEIGRNKNCALRVSYCPLDPDLPDGVCFEESEVCFLLADTTDSDAVGRINMKRFLDRDKIGRIRAEYRMNERLREALIDSAQEALAESGRYHFALEQIYSSCMNFDALTLFTQSFCDAIFQ